MRVPLSWLREYVDLPDVSARELAEKLITAGLEVESVEVAVKFAATTSPTTESLAMLSKALTSRIASTMSSRPARSRCSAIR